MQYGRGTVGQGNTVGDESTEKRHQTQCDRAKRKLPGGGETSK